jgi:uncharacterized protein involved in outer membrane biogenesis
MLLLAVGIPLPLGPVRPVIERRAGDALEREVEVGSLRLLLGFHPGIRLDDLRIGHPEASRPDVLTLERLQVKLDLIPLLRKRFHLKEIAARGATLRLDPAAIPQVDSDTQAEVPGAEPPSDPLRGWSLDVDSLSVEEADASYANPEGETVRVRLDALTAALRWEEATEIRAQGEYQAVPVDFDVEAGPIAKLLAHPDAWPLSLRLRLADYEARLRLQLAARPGSLRLDEIEGVGGLGAELTGWLALENTAGRPRIRGDLRFGAIDLSPYLEPSDGESATPAGAAAPARASDPDQPEEVALPPRRGSEEGPGPVLVFFDTLETFDTDLKLSLERLSGAGPPLEEVAIELQVAAGELDFPIALTAAGVPLQGTLGLDRRDGKPHAAFALATSGPFRIDALGAYLAPQANLQGGFQELRTEVEGSGASLREFLISLRVALVARGAELSYGSESPVPVGVETLEVTLEERGPCTVRARGELLGEALRMDVSGGTVEALLGGEGWPLHLQAAGAGAEIELEGEVRGSLVMGTGQTEALLRIEGEQLSRLEPWLGALPVADASYALRARIERTPLLFRTTLEEVRLGETRLTGELGVQGEGEERLAWVDLQVGTVDLSKLLVEAPGSAAETAPVDTVAAEEGVALDAPILPGGIHLRDADLSLAVAQLRLARVALSDFRFQGAIRDGHVKRSPFGFRSPDAVFEGALSMDLRRAPHQASFEFGARDLDLGGILERLGIAEGVKAKAGSVQFEVTGRGSTLAEVIADSELLARIEGARWVLSGAGSGDELPLLLDRAELRSGGGELIRLVAAGSVKGRPLELVLRTGHLSFFRDAPDHLPLHLRAEAAGAALEIETSVALPVRERRFEGTLSLSGERLDGLASLLGYELPPAGPYRLGARLQATPSAYLFSDLDLRVADSQLRGEGSLQTGGVRPRVDIQLVSDQIQIDDFTAEAETEVQPETPGAPVAEQARVQADLDVGGLDVQVEAPDAPAEPVRFFTPEGLRRFDGGLAMRVDHVLLGEDELGNTELVVTLEDGRLRVDPLKLALPGGEFLLEMDYAHSGSEVAARVRAFAEQLEYGIVARRRNPNSEMGGMLTLDLDIEGSAPSGEDPLAHASGRLDFMVFPRMVEADAIDLWATSLLWALLPRLDSEPRSVVNCVVARFDLDDGLMRERALLLDTTGMVVRGAATIDLRKRQLEAVLGPQSKKPALLSLQTPVTVKGGFRDFHIGVAVEDVLRTFVRFVTSVVIVPIQRIFVGGLPADGVATCRAAWNEGRGDLHDK